MTDSKVEKWMMEADKEISNRYVMVPRPGLQYEAEGCPAPETIIARHHQQGCIGELAAQVASRDASHWHNRTMSIEQAARELVEAAKELLDNPNYASQLESAIRKMEELLGSRS